MTEEQHEHLNHIRGEFVLRLDGKYPRGQAEHGGNLWDKNPIWMADQILDETTDQITYGQTNKDQWISFLNLVTMDPDRARQIAEEWLKELK